jgi:FeS assembly SUF system protein
MNLLGLLRRDRVADNLRERVVEALRQIHDPEIPLNIYDLGLIYGLDIDDMGRAEIRMTLTAPACPVAHTFPALVEDVVAGVRGISRAHVELVWDPPWGKRRLTEAARLQLGLL